MQKNLIAGLALVLFGHTAPAAANQFNGAVYPAIQVCAGSYISGLVCTTTQRLTRTYTRAQAAQELVGMGCSYVSARNVSGAIYAADVYLCNGVYIVALSDATNYVQNLFLY